MSEKGKTGSALLYVAKKVGLMIFNAAKFAVVDSLKTSWRPAIAKSWDEIKPELEAKAKSTEDTFWDDRLVSSIDYIVEKFVKKVE